MSRRFRHAAGGLAIAFGALATAAFAPAAAVAKVYIADYDGKILSLNPKSGKVSTIAKGAPLSNPTGIAIGNNGKLLVSDYGADSIFSVNPDNGNVKTIASGPPLKFPFDLQQSRNGAIYVSDANAGPDEAGAVFQVDPGSGNVALVVQGPPLVNARGLALGRHHRLFVADDGFPGTVFRVDIREATVEPVAAGAPLVNPMGLELGPSGLLYTTDYSAGPGGTGAIFTVDPGSGKVSGVRKGPPLDRMYGIAFDARQRLFVPAAPDTNQDDAVFRMTATGDSLRTYLSKRVTNPYGVAVGG